MAAALAVSLRWPLFCGWAPYPGVALADGMLELRWVVGREADSVQPDEPWFTVLSVYVPADRNYSLAPDSYYGTAVYDAYETGGKAKLWVAYAPIWPVIIPLAVLLVYLRLTDRRIPPGHCQKCGYDLTANVSGACPECGISIAVDEDTN
jgi:hypothetical protein